MLVVEYLLATSAAIPRSLHAARILSVLAFPVPIAIAVAPVLFPWQPHCALVAGVHVEGVVPSVVATSRYVHVAVRSTPHVNDVGKLFVVGAT